MTPIGIHGEKSYHLTTTKTPDGNQSYGRIKFADCVHHYCLYDGIYTSYTNRKTYGMMVLIYDLQDNLIALGDDYHCITIGSGEEANKSQAIDHAKAMVEYHLNDDHPLWTPSGYTTDASCLEGM